VTPQRRQEPAAASSGAVVAPWTPQRGTMLLIERYGGEEAARSLLTRLLDPRTPPEALAQEPLSGTLCCIGDGHAERLLLAGGDRLGSWPRVWSLRALAYLGDDDVAPLLLRSLADVHWRVRMTAAQTLGRVGAEGYDDEIGALLIDEHRRVRAAAALALGRVGHELALGPLAAACSDVDPVVRSAAERAYARVAERTTRSTNYPRGPSR
jgi:HEAT repeat protein